MDLIDENYNENKKDSQYKTKASLGIVIALIILLSITAVLVWTYSQVLMKEIFKVSIDGQSNSKAGKHSGLFMIEDGKVYTSINDICEYVGYSFYRGGYKQFTEDISKCYVGNSKEFVTFSSGSKEIVKYPNDVEDLPQSYEIDEEVILKDNKLYVSPQGLSKAFNLKISYNEENNAVSILTLPYLSEYYETTLSTVSLKKSEFEEGVIFNNEKAILSNLFITQDPNTLLFGVSSINDAGQLVQVISSRYLQLEYMEGTEDFIITTDDEKVGIIGSDGTSKVAPNYDSIKIIDRNIGLYLVSSNDKQGVVNTDGKIIVHQDFDSIGLDVNSYNDANVRNRYLLGGNCIPVKLNNKWGLIDASGETIAQVQYDGIGCSTVPETGEKNTNGIVIIPDIQGIVIEVDNVVEEKRDNKIEKNVIKRYGVINALNGELMINTVLESAYAITTQEVTRYYMTFEDQEYNIIDWWEELRKPSEENSDNNTTQEETDNNSTQGNSNNNSTQENTISNRI